MNRMAKIFFFILFFSSLLSLACSDSSTNTVSPWTVTGTVTDQDGLPLEGVGLHVDFFADRATIHKTDHSAGVHDIVQFDVVSDGAGGWILSWQTDEEAGLSGFHVWRNEVNVDYILLTDTLIPGEGDLTSGHIYEYHDTNTTAGSEYCYEIEAVYTDGSSDYTGPVCIGVEIEQLLPASFQLEQNYPNPFNPVTEFRYSLPEPSHVTITVYDWKGDLLNTLVDRQQEAGYHAINYDASDSDGRHLSNGLYEYRVSIGEAAESKVMCLNQKDPPSLQGGESYVVVPLAETDASGRYTVSHSALHLGESVPHISETGTGLGVWVIQQVALVLTKPGYDPVVQTIAITMGEHTEIHFQMQPSQN